MWDPKALLVVLVCARVSATADTNGEFKVFKVLYVSKTAHNITV